MSSAQLLGLTGITAVRVKKTICSVLSFRRFFLPLSEHWLPIDYHIDDGQVQVSRNETRWKCHIFSSIGARCLIHLFLDKMAATLADPFFKRILLNENNRIAIQYSVKIVSQESDWQ